MLIQPYTPQWFEDFTKLKAVLDKALNGLDYRIEHVGSTAVPGLAAKAIIDIDIVYQQHDQFDKIKEALLGIGYYHNGDQGIPMREVFKRDGQSSDEILDHIRHHLYVCPAESPALERHLLSRDHLRKHEWARVKYQEMKYELAGQANQDKKRYAALKEEKVNAFIDSIVRLEKEFVTNKKTWTESVKSGAYTQELDWFAIDQRGQVGVFSAINEAPIPCQVGTSYELFKELESVILGLPKICDAQLISQANGNLSDWLNYSRKGLFAFDYQDVHRSIENKLKQYDLISVPSKALHASELNLSEAFKAVIPVLDCDFSDGDISNERIIQIR